MKALFKKGRFLTFIALCILLCPGIFLSIHAGAEENQSLKASIIRADGLSETYIGLKVDIPNSSWSYMDVYRSADQGSFVKIDRISWYAVRLSDSNGNLYVAGTDKKVIWYPNNAGTVCEVYDTSASLGHVYTYKIVLSDSWETGPESNTISASPVLSAPYMLDAIRVSGTSLSLRWSGSKQTGGFELQRKSGSSWKKIGTFSKKKTSYTDSKLKTGTYKYRIRAYKKVKGKKMYSPWSNTLTGRTKAPTVKGTYRTGSVYGPSLSQTRLNEVRAVVQNFKDNYIKASMSEVQKVWTAFSYLRMKSDYAWRGWQYNGANTAWGALVYGEAQCSGYARAMKALCDAIGIKCYYIHANAKASNPSHQWNLVRVDKKWYIVDAQGGFFLVGLDQWASTGLTWNTAGLPKCSKRTHSQGGFVSSEI